MSNTESTSTAKKKTENATKLNYSSGSGIIHRKTKAIRKQIATVSPISQWSSLSLPHDQIDQQLDKLLQDSLNSLTSDSRVLRDVKSSTSHYLNKSSTTLPLDSLTSNEVGAAGGVGTGGAGISSNSQSAEAESPVVATINGISTGIASLLSSLEQLEPLYSEVGNVGAKYNRLAGGHPRKRKVVADYDPTLTYKVGKHVLLSNLLTDQIQLFVDYLFVASQRIESIRDYWSSRYVDSPNSWYIIEKTPLFWLKYWRQQLRKRIYFEKKLARLHQTANYSSPFITVSNKLHEIRVDMERLVRKNIMKQTDTEIDEIINSRYSNNNNSSNNNGGSDGISPCSSEEVSPITSDSEDNDKQDRDEIASKISKSIAKSDDSNDILHPTKEIELRIARLDKLLKLVAIAIGRLTFYIGNMKNFTSLSQFNVIASQAVILVYDSVLMFGANIEGGDILSGDEKQNSDINYHINQLVEMSRMIQERMRDYDVLTDPMVADCALLNQPDTEKYQESLYFMVRSNTVAIQKFFGFMQLQIANDQHPGWLSRNWMKITVGLTIGYLSGSYLYDNYSDFKSSATDYYRAWHRFAVEHIELPLRNIWNRMVVDYNRDMAGGNLNESDIATLVDLAAKGDITTVMRPYEAAIEKPFKSLVLGDLVQKEKVDVDKAMQAIDKLLQSNELNFQLLAAIPAVLLLTALGWQINQLVRGGNTTAKMRRAQSKILSALRSMHRQLTFGKHQTLPTYLSPLVMASSPTYFTTFYPGLKTISGVQNNNSNSNNDGSKDNYEQLTSEEELKIQCIPFEQYGTLLLTTDKLKHYIQHIKNKSENQWLNEDLQDLESDHLANNEKILTIQRIYIFIFIYKYDT
ncbi:hypothetical protein PPL_10739 [Heterostelium album PN500]|uniref:Nuclear control of ATPase protein 2 n=1 Tax=Heterostelium pallidum (strain ATCC 26659 / Pp 5 / PN500) TaxID=670386 RepID=D3BSB3_HETP5|nr:hypothetical protein PPL_10739 [Heterostelium album PN500]EFA75686.1 hypothetical protein PPL_10739 [Heterostelium album PN500]|eukprot:XP_020427820.1 hypothetical protein PPL_10739 [Heterostelium album PN500]